jgi:uncharacterized protein (DUF2461 family)
MPKKHKAIEGVGAGSIVQLKAQLYRTQEEARKAKDSNPSSSSSSADAFRARKRSAASPDFFSQKNSGVESRAHKYSCFSLSLPRFSYKLLCLVASSLPGTITVLGM